jgi:DNA-binding response OmpR family regulator
LPDVPFIFVSGTIGEERAIEALRCGAVDYVLKSNLKRLAPAVTRALREAEQRAERAAQQARIERLTRISGDVVWNQHGGGQDPRSTRAAARGMSHRGHHRTLPDSDGVIHRAWQAHRPAVHLGGKKR